MRILKTLIAILIVSLLVVTAVGCNGATKTTATTATKQVKVTIGTISNAVTGTATLGLAKTQNLAFEMAGTVDEILVEESETVTKDQLLATLDTSTWEDNIKTLETSVSNTQRTLNTKEFALTKAKRVIETKQLAKKQAELTLRAAQETLASIDDVQAAQKALDTINNDITFADTSRRAALVVGDTSLAEKWVDQLKYLNESLETAENRMTKVRKGTDVSSDKIALQIVQDVFAVEQAQKAVNDAQIAIGDAQVDIDNAQLDVNDAKSSVATAQGKLDDLKALNPVVKAPFDGFITSIKVAGGADILKGTVAMQIADPNQFEASFMVSESDIFSVAVGQTAVVSVDADGESFPAKVTAIAPLATTSSGVVTYKVTAELTSLIPIASAVSPPSSAASSGASLTGAAGSAVVTTTASSTTLKQGLSASVTITIQEKKNVLIVPTRAITTQGRKSTVQVVEGTATNTVDVTTGLSDSSNIEIVSGLTEGQTVIVKASGSASTSAFGPGGGAMPMIP
jgi:HlyD family secretion protein